MTNASVVYVTYPHRDEAEAAARGLLEDRLAACANLVPGVTSWYRWEGRIQSDSEVVMIVKTRSELVPRVIERLREQHSYDCPCITSWPIADGSAPYLRWIEENTTL
jgi:periplasmic divalent cation tolerance protein